MSEKRVVGRSIVFALGMVCVILIAGLVGAMAYYTITINNKDNEVNSLKVTINQLDATIAHQNNAMADQNSAISYLNGTINNLKRAKLVWNYWARDVRPLNGTPYLYVYGTLLNVGNETAYNCKIHVTVWQDFPIVTPTINSDIVLGTIYGQSLFQSLQGEYVPSDGIVQAGIPLSPSWATINTTVPYSGSAITDWSLSLPQWTATP